MLRACSAARHVLEKYQSRLLPEFQGGQHDRCGGLPGASVRERVYTCPHVSSTTATIFSESERLDSMPLRNAMLPLDCNTECGYNDTGP